MKLNLRLFLPMALASFLLAAGASYADTVTVPKGTDVPLVFDQAFSSNTAKPGDKVALHVAQDVQVDGKIVIHEGTKVTGIISRVEKRRHFGVNAKIQLTFDPVSSVFGPSIPIEPKNKGKYAGSRTDKAAIISGGSAVILGPVGLVGGYFVVGKQVQVKAGDKIISEVSRDTALASR